MCIACDFQCLSVLAVLLIMVRFVGELFGNIGRNLASRISGPQPYKPDLSLDGKVAGMDTLRINHSKSCVCSLPQLRNASITDLFTHLVRTKVSVYFDEFYGCNCGIAVGASPVGGHAGLHYHRGKCWHWV